MLTLTAVTRKLQGARRAISRCLINDGVQKANPVLKELPRKSSPGTGISQEEIVKMSLNASMPYFPSVCKIIFHLWFGEL